MSGNDLYVDYVLPSVNLNTQILKLIQSIEETELKEYTQLYLNNDFNLENIEISMDKMKDTTKTNFRSSFYKQQKLNYLNYFYVFLILLYVFIFGIMCVLLYKKTHIYMSIKILILICLFCLPIVSTKLLLLVLYFFQKLHKYFPKNVYLV
jgi:hypothetical protein